jgi:hypothetical protein
MIEFEYRENQLAVFLTEVHHPATRPMNGASTVIKTLTDRFFDSGRAVADKNLQLFESRISIVRTRTCLSALRVRSRAMLKHCWWLTERSIPCNLVTMAGPHSARSSRKFTCEGGAR